jgi:hypothetical protein
MENETEYPMDEIQKIREALKPLGYEIIGFDLPERGVVTELKIMPAKILAR